MNTSILSIDPGARHWGVSVFSGKEILSSCVKNLSPKDSCRNRLPKVRTIFLYLCKKYSPRILVLEKSNDGWERQSKHLQKTIAEIKKLARYRRIKIVEFLPKTVRKILCQNEQARKGEIREIICRFYPELKPYLEDGQKNNKYWWPMVNSMALGISYLFKKQ
jgi:Holliday junction resolvasome RuvABC endonuclease subunit